MKHSHLKPIFLLVVCLCLGSALFATFSSARTAYAATTATTRAATCYLFAWTFARGYVWNPGNSNSITTCKGNTLKLTYQTDANFVLYCNGKDIWHTGTDIPWWVTSNWANYTSFQTDGNLVVYTWVAEPPGSFNIVSIYQWASGTDRRGAGALILQRDGNLVIYQGAGGVNALWSTRTNGRC